MQSWPDAVPFVPEIGADSPVLQALVRGPAAALSAVLLVVGDRARASGFGAEAAFAIADAWSAADRTPVLVDLVLEEPNLHAPLGLNNDEGVSDAFSFGTSLRMLWRPVANRRFSFLAGGYASDPEEVRASAEWRRIIAQEAATGHTLLLYVPAHAPGVEALAGKVGAVIVIAEEGDLPAAADSLPRPYAVVAVLKPDVPAEAPTLWDAVPETPTAPTRAPITAIPTTAGIAGGGKVPTEQEFEASPEAPDEISASEDLRPARRSPPLVVDDVLEAERTDTSLSPRDTRDYESGDRVSDADFDRIRVPREGAGREELIADLRARQRAALMAPPSDAPVPSGWAAGSVDAGLTIDGIDRRGDIPAPPHTRADAAGRAGWDPPTPGDSRDLRLARVPQPAGTLPGEPPTLRRGDAGRGKRRTSPWLWPGLLAAFVFIAIGAVYYLKVRAEAAARTAQATPNTAIPPVDSLAMVPLPYVVAIEAHTQLANANERLQTLRDSEKGEHFFVAPLVRAEKPYYHVFAGPVRDSATAAAVLDTLLAHKVKTGAVPGDVRQVPLSFVIGTYSSEKDALDRVEDLSKTGIPTFTVEGAVNGAKLWRVYGGAYAGPAESDMMRALLKGAGVKDSLVTRTGRSNQ